ncbi:MAG: AlkZ family DNA glycosylase [Kineosporiaceae bacterium]|nr:AlkZ family DNA glycosylase [Kineosporiaceae bacterium]
MTPRRIAVWRLHSQHLAGRRPPDPAATVRSLLAVQAENPSQSAWAVATRTAPSENGDPLGESDIGRSLDAGEFVRSHVLRPTWHYVHADDIRWLVELTAPAVRRLFRQQQRTVGLDDATARRAIDVVVEALTEGHLTRPELGERLAAHQLPDSGQALMLVVGLAEQEALICSGVQRGHGQAAKQTYALLDERAPNARRLDRDEALAELALRYMTSHGPATERDLAYWATLPLTDVRAGLAAASAQLDSFEHDGRTFWCATADPGLDRSSPRAHLLQLLDEYYRGYQDSRIMLDAAGLLTPGREPAVGMLVVDGQVLGRMRRTVQPRQVRFDVELLRPLADDELAAAEQAAARYGAFLGRTPQLRFVEPR